MEKQWRMDRVVITASEPIPYTNYLSGAVINTYLSSSEWDRLKNIEFNLKVRITNFNYKGKMTYEQVLEEIAREVRKE